MSKASRPQRDDELDEIIANYTPLCIIEQA